MYIEIDTISKEIKPCPFCNSTNISFNAFSFSEDSYVSCENCGVEIDVQVPWDGMDKIEHDNVCTRILLEKWNTRVN